MKILDFETIKQHLDINRAYEALKEGFIAHSLGKTRSCLSHLSSRFALKPIFI